MLFVILAAAASYALTIHTKIYWNFAYKFICLVPKVYLEQSLLQMPKTSQQSTFQTNPNLNPNPIYLIVIISKYYQFGELSG